MTICYCTFNNSCDGPSPSAVCNGCYLGANACITPPLANAQATYWSSASDNANSSNALSLYFWFDIPPAPNHAISTLKTSNDYARAVRGGL